MVVVVHAANIQDRDGARIVFDAIKATLLTLRKVWADGGYAGALIEWVASIRRRCKLDLEIVKRPADAKGFTLLKRRWVVERTFAWLGRYRRLSKDYEERTDSSEAMIHIAMIGLMTRRLASGVARSAPA